MKRVMSYRGFDIHVSLFPVASDMYNVTFTITGHNICRKGADGAEIHIRQGPFSRRWAYLIAEIAGQAAIDSLLSRDAEPKFNLCAQD